MILHIKTLLIAFLLIWCVSVEAPVQAEPSPVTLSLSHRVGTAPATFRVLVRIEPHEDNRIIRWCYDGPALKCSSVQLEGSRSERSITRYWQGLRCGHYTAQAMLGRITNGQERLIRSLPVDFRVVGGGCPIEDDTE